jgi:hypothetical protein
VTWTIENVQEAAVDPAAVWALYADPATWSTWGHNATWASADGPLIEGGIVRVRANYGTVYRCVIRRLEPGRALELVVRPAGLTIVNVYEVEPAEAGARIRHAFVVSGPLAGFTRLTLAWFYRRLLEHEVHDAAALAADPAAGRRAHDSPLVTPPERAWHRAGRFLRGGREEHRGE